MPIERGDNPEGNRLNKFIGSLDAPRRDGYRGLLSATNDDGTMAIILALNGPQYGNLVMVEEIDRNQYPQFRQVVDSVPRGFRILDFGE